MFPALFLSHGAPTLPLVDAPASAFLKGLGQQLGRPSAIIVASAHWETAAPTLSTIARNTTIHDFYGFPRALYELRYEPPGDPADHLALEFDRHVVPPPEVGVEAGGEHLPEHAGQVARPMDPPHERRMEVAGPIGQYQPQELPMDLREPGGAPGGRLAQGGPDRVGPGQYGIEEQFIRWAWARLEGQWTGSRSAGSGGGGWDAMAKAFRSQ